MQREYSSQLGRSWLDTAHSTPSSCARFAGALIRLRGLAFYKMSSTIENALGIERALNRQHTAEVGDRQSPNAEVPLGFSGTTCDRKRRIIGQRRAKR